MITSSSLANLVAETLKKHDVIVSLYTGEDLAMDDHGIRMRDKKRDDLASVNTAWAKPQVVIYTSSITAGVDC